MKRYCCQCAHYLVEYRGLAPCKKIQKIVHFDKMACNGFEKGE
ncbi:MAG: hypothetical protein ACXQTP_05750 [Candidatus Methanofastidiosia archaeon]